MFYLKLIGEMLAVWAAVTLVVNATPHPYVAGGAGIAAFVWFIWTLARVARHATRRPAESSVIAP